MIEKRKRKQYDSLKEFDGQQYTGMRVGGIHSWNYRNGIWNETKISPDKWEIEFICNKYRTHKAPIGTGALNNTKYHWYIIADQIVNKTDANTYSTVMTGIKYKIAHKRPNWSRWSYQYKGETYEEKVINVLEEVINKLKAKNRRRELTTFFEE